MLFATIEEAVRFLDEEVHPQQPPIADAALRARVLALSLALEFPEVDSWQRLFVSGEGFDQRLLILVDALCREHLLGWPLLESLGEVARGEGPAELPTRVLESSVFGALVACVSSYAKASVCDVAWNDEIHTLCVECVYLCLLRCTHACIDELAPEELQAEGYEVLCLRCEALLQEYPTTLEHDARELQQLKGKEGDEATTRRRLALQYRANKKRVLLNAIQYMRSM